MAPRPTRRRESGVPLKIFVLGSARSGTSALGTSVKTLTRVPGPGETHVMPVFQSMLDTHAEELQRRQRKPRLTTHKLTKEFVTDGVVEMARRFYAGLYPGGSWIDKTPGHAMIRAAPLIRAAWPDARIVVLKRTGTEVVKSFTTKFNVPVERAARAWVLAAQALAELDTAALNILVVDQFDMATDPAATAELICGHLGVPDQVEPFRMLLSNGDKQRSAERAPARLRVSDMGWSRKEEKAFLAHCGEMMERLGYPL